MGHTGLMGLFMIVCGFFQPTAQLPRPVFVWPLVRFNNFPPFWHKLIHRLTWGLAPLIELSVRMVVLREADLQLDQPWRGWIVVITSLLVSIFLNAALYVDAHLQLRRLHAQRV